MNEATPAVAPSGTLPRNRLRLLFAVMLVIAAGNTAQQSVMPAIGTELGVADVWISLAYTCSAVLWTTCAPIWARRSDRRGRKAMMALGLVGFIASFLFGGIALWFGFAGIVPAMSALVLFALARMFYGGLGSAAPPAVQAYIASRTPPEERTQAMAFIASAFGLGTVIGPALAPVIVVPGLGLLSSFAVYVVIGAAMLFMLRTRLPDDTPAYAARGAVVAYPGTESGEAARPEDDEAGEVPRLGWTDTRLRRWVLSGILAIQAQAAVTGFVGFLVLDRLGLRDTPEAGAGPIGLVMMAGALATLLAQWGVIPRVDVPPRWICMGGAAAAALGVALLSGAASIHPIAVGYALVSFGFGLFRPGYTAGASLAVTRAEQGQVAGIVTSVNGAAYVAAPVIGVWLYNHAPLAGFAICGGLCLLAIAALAVELRGQRIS